MRFSREPSPFAVKSCCRWPFEGCSSINFPLNIALDRDVEDFLQNQVASLSGSQSALGNARQAGVCDTPGKLINDLVSSIRDQQQRPLT
jgi:hypothetical protein